ncbi:hypothetical protein TNCV_4311111 [Trichonephila clavipes]|nr:hypothetical protein TNCV_4311111 [Trichonephila clavipes]
MQTCLLFLNTEDFFTVEPNATASTPATVESDLTASTPTQPSTRSGRKVHLPTRSTIFVVPCSIGKKFGDFSDQRRTSAV